MAIKTLEYFGAKGNNKTNDSAAFQKACNSVIEDGNSIEAIPKKKYVINDPVFIPPFRGSFLFNGHGSLIRTDNPEITMFSKKVKDQDDALNNHMQSKLRWSNIEFLGTGTGKQNSILCQATYGSKFENVHGTALGRHLHMQFCLAARIEQCYGTNNKEADFTSTIGDWNGWTESNSQCNHTVFEGCRSYGDENQTCAYYIGGSSGVKINDCIIEGRNTTRGIVFDDKYSTVVKHHFIHNLHVENSPDECAIYINMRGGIVDINFFAQIPKTVLVKTSSVTAADVLIRQLAWIPDGATFEAEVADVNWKSGKWHFKEMKSDYIKPDNSFWNTYFPKGVPYAKSLEFTDGKFVNGEGYK